MSSDKENEKEEVICEFFGLKIATKNPNLAKVLKTEVSEFMKLNITEVKGYLVNPDQKDIDAMNYKSVESDEETDVDIELEVGEVIDISAERTSQVKSDEDENDETDLDKLVEEWFDKY